MIRLSCASLSFDGFGDSDFARTFAHAAEIGYRHLEFNCWHPRTLTSAGIRRLKQRCVKAGLAPGSLHISSFGGDGAHDLTKDVCHKIRGIDAAAELGCKMVSATGAPRGSEGGLDGIITVLREVVPYAEEKGVSLSLENHVGSNLENLEDYQRVLDEVSSSAMGICMDTGHFDAAGVRLDDLIDRFADRINHIHLKENRGFGRKEFVAFGSGTTANQRIVERMLDLGYQGYLVIEVSPEIGDAEAMDPLERVRTPWKMFSKYEDRG